MQWPHSIHAHSRAPTTPHWLVQWSHHCSHMSILVHSLCLPGYTDVAQPILVILTMAGLFPDRPHIFNSLDDTNMKPGLGSTGLERCGGQSWGPHVPCKDFVGGFKRFFTYLFLERGRKRGRETFMCSCLVCAPYWGLGPQRRHVPWLGINQRPLGSLAGTQSTEPHQPGPCQDFGLYPEGRAKPLQDFEESELISQIYLQL